MRTEYLRARLISRMITNWHRILLLIAACIISWAMIGCKKTSQQQPTGSGPSSSVTTTSTTDSIKVVMDFWLPYSDSVVYVLNMPHIPSTSNNNSYSSVVNGYTISPHKEFLSTIKSSSPKRGYVFNVGTGFGYGADSVALNIYVNGILKSTTSGKPNVSYTFYY